MILCVVLVPLYCCVITLLLFQLIWWSSCCFALFYFAIHKSNISQEELMILYKLNLTKTIRSEDKNALWQSAPAMVKYSEQDRQWHLLSGECQQKLTWKTFDVSNFDWYEKKWVNLVLGGSKTRHDELNRPTRSFHWSLKSLTFVTGVFFKYLSCVLSSWKRGLLLGSYDQHFVIKL